MSKCSVCGAEDTVDGCKDPYCRTAKPVEVRAQTIDVLLCKEELQVEIKRRDGVAESWKFYPEHVVDGLRNRLTIEESRFTMLLNVARDLARVLRFVSGLRGDQLYVLEKFDQVMKELE